MPLIAARGTGKRLAEILADRARAAQTESPRPAQVGAAWMPCPVEDVLLRRRSVREFSAASLPAYHVQDAVAAAHTADAALWPSWSDGHTQLDILVAARRIDGLASGIYRGDSGQAIRDLHSSLLDALGEQYADAPALLLICGDLNSACETAGAGGYATMLVRAGTAGYAAWLRAVSAGLAGSVYGRAAHSVTAAARLYDTNLRHLFTVALGASPGKSL